MKKFKYRLDKVLSIRQIREKQAEALLAQARNALLVEQHELEARVTGRNDGLLAYRHMLQIMFHPDMVETHQAYLCRLDDEITEQRDRVKKALERVTLHQRLLLAARQERKALSKLRERRLQEHSHFSLIEEQKELDDMKRSERR